mgnify:CR=1 FL=1
MAAMLSDEMEAYSVDDMNKLRVGQLAVSRYHQISNFFLTDASPNYPDHDFPHPGYLLIPCGYMNLKLKQVPETSEDGPEELLTEASLNDYSNPLQNSKEEEKVTDDATLQAMTPLPVTYKGQLLHAKLGRHHIATPHTGPATIALRASKF